ncbi:hypothetical protein [Cupriavidus pauculus]|uniref:Iron-containing redox enzyme family protein n=1 Tax=Cupriavidus pauculus TaxID=82633 RepID=A0A3G8H719_9BURK|nr:hypothetical protein [Cupriavidus pauculus]AZG16341.1 hypothetical protein EHF44_23400 [Cupriavidus pauculus]
MQAVLAHILRRKLSYAQLPLFERMRDERLPPQIRLDFMRGFAFFVMAFGDLNRYLLRRAPHGDAHQAKVNAHTYEDDHHWPWYLEDFRKLGWDTTTTTTDALRTLWSDDTHRCRVLMYELCAIVAQARDGAERLAVIEAIEETGNVLFSLTTPLAEALHPKLGVELRYLGPFHFALESGHAQHADHRAFAAIVLDDARRQHCIALVDRVFDAFTAWTDEAAGWIDRAAA